MKNIIKYSLAVATLLVLHASPAWAAGSVQTTSDVTDSSDNVVGSSTLRRTSQGVSVTIHTTGIPAGHAVTVWVCIIRNDGNFDCLRAAGHVVGADGQLNASGAVKVGDTSESISPALGADGLGLLDPFGDFVVVVVRDHGLAIPGQIPNQFHSYQPECVTCTDAQSSIHSAP